jgi:hypothetical protein
MAVGMPISRLIADSNGFRAAGQQQTLLFAVTTVTIACDRNVDRGGHCTA